MNFFSEEKKKRGGGRRDESEEEEKVVRFFANVLSTIITFLFLRQTSFRRDTEETNVDFFRGRCR